MNETAKQAQPEVKRSLWRRWLIDPVVAQLRQGITPERIALTLALASIISVFPILGSTTLLCALVAAWLRLNQPLIQLANRSEEHTSELQSLMRNSYAVFCLTQKQKNIYTN